MGAAKKLVSKKVREVAKSAVRNSVGKSLFPFGHVWEMTEEVEKWVIESRNLESADQNSAVH